MCQLRCSGQEVRFFVFFFVWRRKFGVSCFPSDFKNEFFGRKIRKELLCWGGSCREKQACKAKSTFCLSGTTRACSPPCVVGQESPPSLRRKEAGDESSPAWSGKAVKELARQALHQTLNICQFSTNGKRWNRNNVPPNWTCNY